MALGLGPHSMQSLAGIPTSQTSFTVDPAKIPHRINGKRPISLERKIACDKVKVNNQLENQNKIRIDVIDQLVNLHPAA